MEFKNKMFQPDESIISLYENSYLKENHSKSFRYYTKDNDYFSSFLISLSKKSFQNIEKLSFQKSNLSLLKIEPLSISLSKIGHNLKSLNLSYNPLFYKSVKLLLESIVKLNISEIDLSSIHHVL